MNLAQQAKAAIKADTKEQAFELAQLSMDIIRVCEITLTIDYKDGSVLWFNNAHWMPNGWLAQTQENRA